MPLEADIQFIKNNAEDHLEQFTAQVRSSKNETWRCLYASLPSSLTKDVSSKNIASNFLKSAFDGDADEIKVFWLASGHMFIFFQGPVRAIIKDYEGFLDFVSDGQRPDYHFFWEIQEFWGYFDQVLSNAIGKKPPSKVTAKKPDERKSFKISDDLLRQRQARYKPLLLIVEDDRVTRHMLQAIMEKYCDIAVAWDATQAQQFYSSMLPNIAFLDIELPDGDGQDLAELFCSKDPDSFVVMVSGALDHDKIERCIKAGVKGAVAKPASEKKLLSFIDQYHKARRAKAASG